MGTVFESLEEDGPGQLFGIVEYSGSMYVKAKRSWKWTSRGTEKKVSLRFRTGSGVVRDSGRDITRVRDF